MPPAAGKASAHAVMQNAFFQKSAKRKSAPQIPAPDRAPAEQFMRFAAIHETSVNS